MCPGTLRDATGEELRGGMDVQTLTPTNKSKEKLILVFTRGISDIRGTCVYLKALWWEGNNTIFLCSNQKALPPYCQL